MLQNCCPGRGNTAETRVMCLPCAGTAPACAHVGLFTCTTLILATVSRQQRSRAAHFGCGGEPHLWLMNHTMPAATNTAAQMRMVTSAVPIASAPPLGCVARNVPSVHTARSPRSKIVVTTQCALRIILSRNWYVRRAQTIMNERTHYKICSSAHTFTARASVAAGRAAPVECTCMMVGIATVLLGAVGWLLYM